MQIKAKDGTKVDSFQADEKFWNEEEPEQVGSKYKSNMMILMTHISWKYDSLKMRTKTYLDRDFNALFNNAFLKNQIYYKIK